MYKRGTDKVALGKQLANCFNREKDRIADKIRLQRARESANVGRSLLVPQMEITKGCGGGEGGGGGEDEDDWGGEGRSEDPISVFHSTPSSHISLHLNNKTSLDSTPIPKIQLKDVVIPVQNETDVFDVGRINDSIPVIIPMMPFVGDTFLEENIQRLKKTRVTTIHHIYQEKYADNVYVTGFGDFIRGCFFMLQFCRKYGFQCNILILHPIAMFLQKYSAGSTYSYTQRELTLPMFNQSNLKETLFTGSNDISGFSLSDHSLAEYVEYLCHRPVVHRAVSSYVILFPYDEITDREKLYMRQLLTPTAEMETYVFYTMEQLGLDFSTKYVIIHIRSGDTHLKKETFLFDSNYFRALYNELNQIIELKHDGTVSPYLLIADNNEVKHFMCERFPNIKTIYKDITHLGEGHATNREKIKNTLLDFYLMSHARHIYSFTIYPHGSGFSYWCAKLFDIPYQCKYMA